MASTVVLAPTNRGPGTFTSASIVVPAAGTQIKMRLVANMDVPTKQNPATVFHVELEVSDDGGATFHSYAGFGFTGGPFTDRDGTINPDPYIQVDLAPLVGKRVRAVVDISTAITIGATVSTV